MYEIYRNYLFEFLVVKLNSKTFLAPYTFWNGKYTFLTQALLLVAIKFNNKWLHDYNYTFGHTFGDFFQYHFQIF
jgi:hypothetical protein